MNDSSLISQIGTILGTILGIALILYLAYISTRLIGKRYSVKSVGGKKLKIIESISLGQGKSIVIVKAGEQVFLVGAASDNINLISQLDSSEFDVDINDKTPENIGIDFKTAFKTVLQNNFGKKNKQIDKENENDGSKPK